MPLTICLLIGIAVNLDNFLIGVSLGLRQCRLSMSSNLLIAAVTAFFSFAAAALSDILSENLLFFGQLAGSAFLIGFGLFCLFRPDDNDRVAQKYHLMTVKQTFMLAFVLSVNCIPPAFSAGIFRISPVLMGLCAGMFSFACMYISNRFGNYFIQKPWIQKLTPFSYLLLILIGVIEIFLAT